MESDLEKWVKQWGEGNREGFYRAYEWLQKKYFPLAVWYFHYNLQALPTGLRGESSIKELAGEAFHNAMEEMDLRVSGGKLLLEPTSKTRMVTQEDKHRVSKRVFKGKGSGRELTERERFKWCGEEEFGALFRQVLISLKSTCWSILRREEKYKRSPLENIVVRGDEEYDDQPGGRGVREDKSPGTSSYPEKLSIEREEVLELVDDLGQGAGQLHQLRKRVSANVVESLLLYVKWQAINPHGSALDIAKLTGQDIANLKNKKIEDLLDSSNVRHLDFDEEESWLFVGKVLGRDIDDVYQLKKRLFKDMQGLPVPGILKKMLGLQWLKDMQNWAEDSVKIANRLPERDLKGAEAFDLIRDYLKMKVSEGHYSHRGLSLEQVRKVPQEKLFKANNPDRLDPTYPNRVCFQQFLIKECAWCSKCVNRMVTGTLPELRNVIANLNPRPIRLVTLLALLSPAVFKSRGTIKNERGRA